LEGLLDVHWPFVFVCKLGNINDQFKFDNISFCTTLYKFFIFSFTNFIFTKTIFTFAILRYKGLEYQGYEYPSWSIFLGWIITALSISCVPIYAIYYFIRTKGSCSEVRYTISLHFVFYNFTLYLIHQYHRDWLKHLSRPKTKKH